MVFGVGDPGAKLMIVGEAPGENEDVKGLPFVGAAGNTLNECLKEAGVVRDEINKRGQSGVYITNIVKCRTPENNCQMLCITHNWARGNR